jgi:hypothetical protein
MLSAARVGLSQRSERRHYSIAQKLAAMHARIADERSNKLQRRRLLRRTSAHNPVPIFMLRAERDAQRIAAAQHSSSAQRGGHHPTAPTGEPACHT